MEVVSLQSGSNGNCIYVEAGGNRLLFDAGITGRQAEMRLAAAGRAIRGIDAVIVSHDHSDHTKYAGVYHRKFGLPLLGTEATLNTAHDRHALGRLQRLQHFRAGETISFSGCRVHTIPTPHDGVDGVAFVVDDGDRRLGIFTDLGHVFAGLADVLATLDAVILESNYDPQMLDHGPYPAWLKQRIRGDGGHISNDEAAELLAAAAGPQMQWACLAHLSQDNNRPDSAMAAHRRRLGAGFPLCIASRHEASEVMRL